MEKRIWGERANNYHAFLLIFPFKRETDRASGSRDRPLATSRQIE